MSNRHETLDNFLFKQKFLPRNVRSFRPSSACRISTSTLGQRDSISRRSSSIDPLLFFSSLPQLSSARRNYCEFNETNSTSVTHSATQHFKNGYFEAHRCLLNLLRRNEKDSTCVIKHRLLAVTRIHSLL